MQSILVLGSKATSIRLVCLSRQPPALYFLILLLFFLFLVGRLSALPSLRSPSSHFFSHPSSFRTLLHAHMTDLFNQLKPEYIAPVVTWLCHESCEENGGVFESAGGYVGKYRWSRAVGKTFIPPTALTVESVRDSWNQITDMKNSSMPASVHGLFYTRCSLFHEDQS